MANTTTVGRAVVDVSGLRDLSKALKVAADGTDKRLRTGLKSAGQIVQQQAKENASWSSKIPGKIKVSITQRQVAVVVKDGEAVSYETHGKHPVWSADRKRWNRKPLKRPFLRPAAETRAEEVASAVLDAVANISL